VAPFLGLHHPSRAFNAATITPVYLLAAPGVAARGLVSAASSAKQGLLAAPGAMKQGAKRAASAIASTASAANYEKTKAFNQQIAQAYSKTLSQPGSSSPTLPQLQTALSNAEAFLDEIQERFDNYQGEKNSPEKLRLIRDLHQAKENKRVAEQRVQAKLNGENVKALSGGKKRRKRPNRTVYETHPTIKKKFRRKKHKTRKGRRRFA
jgi:hypothetical protein